MTNEIRPPGAFVPVWVKPVAKQGSEESGKQFRKRLAEAFKEDEEDAGSKDAKAQTPPKGGKQASDPVPAEPEAGDAKEKSDSLVNPEKVGRLLNREM